MVQCPFEREKSETWNIFYACVFVFPSLFLWEVIFRSYATAPPDHIVVEFQAGRKDTLRKERRKRERASAVT